MEKELEKELDLELDIKREPFSRYGSYLAFSHPQDGTKEFEDQISLRVLYGVFTKQDTYPILPATKEGKTERPTGVTMNPWELSVASKGGGYCVCFAGTDAFYIKSQGAVLVTKTRRNGDDRLMCHMDGSWEMAGFGRSLWITVLKGRGERQPAGLFCKAEEEGLLILVRLTGLSRIDGEYESYEACKNQVKEEYLQFEREIVKKAGSAKGQGTASDGGDQREDVKRAVREAAYILWHSVLKPSGYIERPVMVMTKNWMNMVWSWDYAFNAWAAVASHPELAYGQFLAMADRQDEYGVYPDAFQAEAEIRGFVKPPVQGFILQKMFEIHEPEREVKEKLYRSVAAFTNWWLDYRSEQNGIPAYQHGNDSGWDNATVFRLGYPVQSPDLSAWLVIQMEFLERTARELGFLKEGERWRKSGDELLHSMLKYFVRDGRFSAVKLPEMIPVASHSLILYLPLILGTRLPKELREGLLLELLEEGRLAGDWGFASEARDGGFFEEDGYWRGAIWPPVMLILIDALKLCGRKDEAKAYANKFCTMCTRNGFFENYSALDGHGLRDHGFTWTASVFLILLREY